MHQTHKVVFLLFDGHLTAIFDATKLPQFLVLPIKSNYNVKEGIPEQIKEPNAVILKLTKSDKEKADTLQSNFCSVFTKEPQGPLPDIENKHIEHKMHKIRIHEDEIGELLS